MQSTSKHPSSNCTALRSLLRSCTLYPHQPVRYSKQLRLPREAERCRQAQQRPGAHCCGRGRARRAPWSPRRRAHGWLAHPHCRRHRTAPARRPRRWRADLRRHGKGLMSFLGFVVFLVTNQTTDTRQHTNPIISSTSPQRPDNTSLHPRHWFVGAPALGQVTVATQAVHYYTTDGTPVLPYFPAVLSHKRPKTRK